MVMPVIADAKKLSLAHGRLISASSADDKLDPYGEFFK